VDEKLALYEVGFWAQDSNWSPFDGCYYETQAEADAAIEQWKVSDPSGFAEANEPSPIIARCGAFATDRKEWHRLLSH